MLIQTETTPNPAALKFIPGQTVMDHGTRDFATPEAAEASPLAEAIFSTGEVEGVFFGRDFISVTAAPGVEWRQLKPQVLEVLLDHFASGAPLFRPGSAAGISVAPELPALALRAHGSDHAPGPLRQGRFLRASTGVTPAKGGVQLRRAPSSSERDPGSIGMTVP